MQAKLLYLHAISPLHAGTGQGVGVIDLPIAREKATGIPIVPGSTVKGVLRDACGEGEACLHIFGPKTDNASEYAGSVQFTDQRLLLLPVRSLAGTFAWVTSPLLIQRFLRDVAEDGNLKAPELPAMPGEDIACLVVDQILAAEAGNKTGSQLILQHGGSEQVVLEDLVLTPAKEDKLTTWAGWLGSQLFPSDPDWQKSLSARICIVSDNVMSFLLQTGTEVTARIALDDEKKTVRRGALWYEESLPAESVLTGLVIASPVKAEAKAVFAKIGKLAGGALQFGGNATVGRGLCRLRLS